MYTYKLPSGCEVRCTTAEEVVALDSVIAKPASGSRAVSVIRAPHHGQAPPTPPPDYIPPIRNIEFTLKFLRLLVEAGSRGYLADRLAARLELDGVRGLGGATALVNRTLRELGITDEAFETRPVGIESRWCALPVTAAMAEHVQNMLEVFR